VKGSLVMKKKEIKKFNALTIFFCYNRCFHFQCLSGSGLYWLTEGYKNGQGKLKDSNEGMQTAIILMFQELRFC
jgi:hypothetical protein